MRKRKSSTKQKLLRQDLLKMNLGDLIKLLKKKGWRCFDINLVKFNNESASELEMTIHNSTLSKENPITEITISNTWLKGNEKEIGYTGSTKISYNLKKVTAKQLDSFEELLESRDAFTRTCIIKG